MFQVCYGFDAFSSSNIPFIVQIKLEILAITHIWNQRNKYNDYAF